MKETATTVKTNAAAVHKTPYANNTTRETARYPKATVTVVTDGYLRKRDEKRSSNDEQQMQHACYYATKSTHEGLEEKTKERKRPRLPSCKLL